jgi:molybdopterin converting factor small subunit
MELKEILEKLDLPAEIAESDKPEEAFVNAFKAKYISKEMALNDKDIVSKVSGKFFGPLNTKLKQVFGFTHSEIEGKKIEEIIDMGGEKFNTEISTLKETATKGNDEKLSSLTEELDKAKKSAHKYKTDLETLSTTYQQDQEKWKGELKNHKVNYILNTEKSKVPFIDGISPVQKAGYETILKEKYIFDIDDQENPVVYDAKTKEPIQNPKKVGSYYGVKDVLEIEAASNGLLKQNNVKPSEVKKPVTTTSSELAQNGRKVHPNALKLSEQLKQ